MATIVIASERAIICPIRIPRLDGCPRDDRSFAGADLIATLGDLPVPGRFDFGTLIVLFLLRLGLKRFFPIRQTVRVAIQCHHECNP